MLELNDIFNLTKRELYGFLITTKESYSNYHFIHKSPETYFHKDQGVVFRRFDFNKKLFFYLNYMNLYYNTKGEYLGHLEILEENKTHLENLKKYLNYPY